jgi:hypothetical protein
LNVQHRHCATGSAGPRLTLAYDTTGRRIELTEENRRPAKDNAELHRATEIRKAAGAYFVVELDPTRRRSRRSWTNTVTAHNRALSTGPEHRRVDVLHIALPSRTTPTHYLTAEPAIHNQGSTEQPSLWTGDTTCSPANGGTDHHPTTAEMTSCGLMKNGGWLAQHRLALWQIGLDDQPLPCGKLTVQDPDPAQGIAGATPRAHPFHEQDPIARI